MRSQVTRNQSSATKTRNLRKLLLEAMEHAADSNLESVGERIAQARKEAGLTQDELADLIGVGMRQVQNYEAGDSNPYRTLRRIAEATHKSVGWLLHGEPATQLAAEEVAERLEVLEAGQARVEEELAGMRSQLAELLRRIPEPPAAHEAAGD